MGQFIDSLWHPRFATGLSRGQNREGAFRAYLPDLLIDRRFMFEATVTADLTDAERAVARLDREPKVLSNTEGLARILLRAESLAALLVGTVAAWIVATILVVALVQLNGWAT